VAEVFNEWFETLVIEIRLCFGGVVVAKCECEEDEGKKGRLI
jgi:hypothetical protein